MSEGSVKAPKFAVGDRVAVCSSDCSVVIPDTRVKRRSLKPFAAHQITGRMYLDIWLYKVVGDDGWFWEHSLRPVRPDEYDESPTTTEREVSA
jgi:hypothetical protein